MTEILSNISESEKVRSKDKQFSTKDNVIRFALLIFAVLIATVFALIEPAFLKSGNLLNILGSTVVLCIASIGVSMVMITGEIDFACGSELASAACIVAVLSAKHVNYALCVIVALAFCTVVGVINGLLHTRIGIPGFIATMGVSFILDGFNKLITNTGSVHSSTWTSFYTFFGQARVFGVIPVSVLILIAVVIIMLIYTEGMTNGRKLYAVGSNSNACKYIGIDDKKEKMKSFIISAFLCGIAGVINTSQINTANPFMGETTLVNVLTMLMLGATFYRIGVFNVPGTIVGALLINIINNGMVMVGAKPWQQYAVQGLIMITAVTLITLIRRRAARKG